MLPAPARLDREAARADVEARRQTQAKAAEQAFAGPIAAGSSGRMLPAPVSLTPSWRREV